MAGRPIETLWTSTEPVSALTPYYDWDYFTSMAASLRAYLFDYGAVPAWDVMFCGGRPELANPQSWAFTWVSLFAYLFPPNWAVVALWAVLTAVGFGSVYALLKEWTGCRLAAVTGACVYAGNGYFGSHFNVGHATFAFFHLIPLMILCFSRAWAVPTPGRLALLALVTFLLFSGGLPAALFYFYPAFVCCVIWTAARASRQDGRNGFRRFYLAGAAHGLGIGAAAYKLWPIIAWQERFPRSGAGSESMAPRYVWTNLLHFIAGPFSGVPTLWHGQGYGDWDSNAFIGRPAALVATLGLLLIFRRGGLRPVAVLAALLVALGWTLSLGNAYPGGLGSVFPKLPLLSGIRVFVRYQILVVFGFALLDGAAVAWAARRLAPGARLARGGLLALAAAIAGPAMVNFGLLLWHVPAVPDAVAGGAYDAVKSSSPIQIVSPKVGGYEAQRVAIERGLWVGDCYEPMTIPRLVYPAQADLTVPPPAERPKIGGHSIAMDIPADLQTDVTVNLMVTDQVHLNLPYEKLASGQTVVKREDARGQRLVLEAASPGAAEGGAISGASLVVGLWWAIRSWASRKSGHSRDRGRPPPGAVSMGR